MSKLFYRCKRCLLPNTKPDLHFDDDGNCLACKFTDHHEHDIDWKSRKQEFLELISQHKGKDEFNYDCLIAVSGGKDSTYQAYLATQVGGLKTLLVSFEPSFPTELGRKNLQNMVDSFGCDLIRLHKSPAYRRLARIAFDVVGDHEWPNHVGIYCWPVQMALKFKIPLTFYGESGGKIGLGRWEHLVDDKKVTREHIEQYIGMNGYRLSDIMAHDPTISNQDVLPYIYPSREDLEQLDIAAYNLGYFFPWDTQKNIRAIQEHGWQTLDTNVEGTFGHWEDLDCGFMPIHQYFKFIKYGYARATDQAAYELRHGRLTLRQAEEYIREYDWKLPRRYFKEFLDFLEITEEYFFKTVDRFANPILFRRDNHAQFIRMWDDNLIMEELWHESFQSA